MSEQPQWFGVYVTRDGRELLAERSQDRVAAKLLAERYALNADVVRARVRKMFSAWCPRCEMFRPTCKEHTAGRLCKECHQKQAAVNKQIEESRRLMGQISRHFKPDNRGRKAS